MFSKEEIGTVSFRRWDIVLAKMPGCESVPDPDRGDSPVSPSQAPPVGYFLMIYWWILLQAFDPDSTEESDDAEETQEEEGHGYEPINQEETLDDDGLQEQEELSMEEQVAALVRAAQSDQANLSGQTQEEIERAEEQRRIEEVNHPFAVDVLLLMSNVTNVFIKKPRFLFSICATGLPSLYYL